MKFYSQRGEDKWIYENLKIPQDGFFVDVGASDPVVHSNTLFFENIGWKGICIEPNVKWKKKWNSSNRESIIHWGAVGDRHHIANFHVRKNQNFSSLLSNKKLMKMKTRSPNKRLKKTHACAKIKEVTIYTMDEIIDLYNINKIDLLSIDTEGTELDVMKGLTSINPSLIIVEYKTYGIKDNSNKYLNYFLKLGYSLIYDSGLNHLYQY